MDRKVCDWIERVVVESDRRRCASKVCSITQDHAAGRGDNYLSNLKRLTLEVVLNSGERQTRKLIYKTFPAGENRVKMAKRDGIFVKEIRVYQDVLSEMENIWKAKEPLAQFLWPELYSAKRNYEGLLLEDLSVKGFKMGNRLRGLDYEHCKLVVQSLSKFHALGAILRKNGDLRIRDYYPAPFYEICRNIPGFSSELLKQRADTIEQEWKGEWVELAERMRILSKTIDTKINEELKKDESTFLTLNHGDCWVNNILFRYDQNGKPVALKFIDYQMAQYSTPGFDLQYFFQTSLEYSIRSRKPELIQEYHKSLSENLIFFGYPENGIPTLEEIKEYYENKRFNGFLITLGLLPLMLAPKEIAKTDEELDELSKQMNDKEMADIGMFGKGDEYSVKLTQYIIKEAAENGIL